MECDWDKAKDTVRVNDVSESPCPATCNYLSLGTNYGTSDNGNKNVKVTIHVHAHDKTLKKNTSFRHNNLK